MKQLAEFDADPEFFMNNVSEGKYMIKAGEWPAFLYDTGIINPNDLLKGFMQGKVLVCAFQHIFTGPSSAISGTCNATKLAKAHIHGLTKPMGQTLGYAAV
ncbi:hypothetical protein H2248_003608 [Termitomyces sp. 'cryptogamus']|nr:hypothetical protein H2248_003608 [Termitomyces sp. 'cryptogamus']